MHFQEFPKMLYRGTDVLACLADEKLVMDAAQETAARADGFQLYGEIFNGVKAEAPKRTRGPNKVKAP